MLLLSFKHFAGGFGASAPARWVRGTTAVPSYHLVQLTTKRQVMLWFCFESIGKRVAWSCALRRACVSEPLRMSVAVCEGERAFATVCVGIEPQRYPLVAQTAVSREHFDGLSVYIYIYLYIYMYQSIYLLSIYPSIHSTIYLSIHPSMYLYVYLSISIRLSSIYLSAHPSICM